MIGSGEIRPIVLTSTMTVGDGLPQPFRHYTWPTVVERCQRWAAEVKRDVDTPDLWAELRQEAETLTGARSDDLEDTPFTPDEQTEIAKELREIKEYVRKTYSLTETEMRVLEERLDYLEDASRRLPRRKWANEFARAMFAAFLVGALPADAVRDTVRMVLQTLGHLIGHPLPELPAG